MKNDEIARSIVLVIREILNQFEPMSENRKFQVVKGLLMAAAFLATDDEPDEDGLDLYYKISDLIYGPA